MTTRRDFLRQTALLGAGLTISPFFIKAGSAGVGANDKIGVGLIGCNGMGFEDLKAFLRNPEVECIALSDIDENVLNNRAAETEKITGKKVKHLYKDWRKLIDNKDIDLVIVGTPDHWQERVRDPRHHQAMHRAAPVRFSGGCARERAESEPDARRRAMMAAPIRLRV